MTAARTQSSALAEVYATSLLELAEQAGGLGEVQTIQLELDAVARIARQDRQFREFLRSPIISASEKQGALQRIFGDGRVSDLLLRFLLVLNRKERLDQLEAISHAFTRMYWEKTGRVEVEVITADEMSEEQAATVKARIAEALGREPILRRNVDPGLIGGLKLRIGDRMIDASVSTRLAKIRDRLNTSGADAIRNRLDALIAE